MDILVEVLRAILTAAGTALVILATVGLLILWWFIVRSSSSEDGTDDRLEKQLEQAVGHPIEKVVEVLYDGKTPDEIIAHNERMIREDIEKNCSRVSPWRRYTGANASQLILHPTIQCRWMGCYKDMGTMGAWYHDMMDKPPAQRSRPAVWLRDMAHPECVSCLVEDPYE